MASTSHRTTVIAFVPIRCAPTTYSSRHAENTPRDDDAANSDVSEEDEYILEELRSAKKDFFGADIPTSEEFQTATQNAENAFLAAMLEQTNQFQQIKAEKGSDRAVALFMEKIQEEQNPAGIGTEEDNDSKDDSIEKKWFVQRMQEEQNPALKKDLGEGRDEGDDAWQ